MFTGFCLHVSLLSTSVLPISVVVRHSVVVLTILCFISYIQTFHNSTFFYAKCSFIDQCAVRTQGTVCYYVVRLVNLVLDVCMLYSVVFADLFPNQTYHDSCTPVS